MSTKLKALNIGKNGSTLLALSYIAKRNLNWEICFGNFSVFYVLNICLLLIPTSGYLQLAQHECRATQNPIFECINSIIPNYYGIEKTQILQLAKG
jgi:hypothetical protein